MQTPVEIAFRHCEPSEAACVGREPAPPPDGPR